MRDPLLLQLRSPCEIVFLERQQAPLEAIIWYHFSNFESVTAIADGLLSNFPPLTGDGPNEKRPTREDRR